jgi:anti-anti-sigma regulatory factor
MRQAEVERRATVVTTRPQPAGRAWGIVAPENTYLAAINDGARALIADMTATASCDHAAADTVVCACRRGVLGGTELRLVVTAQVVSRVLSISGVDRLVVIDPPLEAATAARPPVTVLAQCWPRPRSVP